MSQRNVEIVRRGLELLQESYRAGTATKGLVDLCAPGVRIDASRRVFNPDVYEGLAGLRRSVLDVCDAWDDFHETLDELIDAGDRVVAIQTISGRGRASQVQVEQKGALIWTLRDELVDLVEVFIDPEEALKAVGLGV